MEVEAEEAEDGLEGREEECETEAEYDGVGGLERGGEECDKEVAEEEI